MHSSIDGFTLPGMIDDPGCTAGRMISARPVCGPEARRRRSFVMRVSSRARLRRAADTATTGSGDEQAEEMDGRYPDGGRHDVVRRLRHVDVIVRMDRLVDAELSAERGVRQVGDHLIAVHVERGAGAGLEYVDDEVPPIAVEVAEDPVAGGDDRIGQSRLHRPELTV